MERTIFTATFLQVRLTYRDHYGEPMPGDMSYQAAAEKLCRDLGIGKAQKLCSGVPIVRMN